MGWTLKYWVRVIGNYPDGSQLNFVISKAGRQISSTRCDAWAYRKTANDVDESFCEQSNVGKANLQPKKRGNLRSKFLRSMAIRKQKNLSAHIKLMFAPSDEFRVDNNPELNRRATSSIATMKPPLALFSCVRRATFHILMLPNAPTEAVKTSLNFKVAQFILRI